jgi:hypothetical protein
MFAEYGRSLPVFRFPTWVGSGLTQNYYYRLERLGRDKHSNFFGLFVNYSLKKFNNIGYTELKNMGVGMLLPESQNLDKKAKLFLFFLLTLFFHWQVFLFQSSGFSVFKRFSSLQALLQSKLECLPFFSRRLKI